MTQAVKGTKIRKRKRNAPDCLIFVKASPLGPAITSSFKVAHPPSGVTVRFWPYGLSARSADADVVSETVEVRVGRESARRLRRTAEEKRRIVEATLAPGASIARVVREHGVNANQVFQWRHE